MDSKISFLLSTVILCFAINSCQIDAGTIVLGVLFPWGGFYPAGSHGAAGAVSIALDAVHSDSKNFKLIHDGGYNFNYTWADTKCSIEFGLPAIADMYLGRKGYPRVNAFIGPVCSVVCEPGGHLLTDWGVPMISFGSTSNLMSDKTLYPTFARTIGPLIFVAPMFVDIMREFEIRRVAIFTGSDAIWTSACATIRNALLSDKVQVTDYVAFEAVKDTGASKSLSSYISIARERSKGRSTLIMQFWK